MFFESSGPDHVMYTQVARADMRMLDAKAAQFHGVLVEQGWLDLPREFSGTH